MNKTGIAAILFFGISITACSDPKRALKESAVNAKIDSIVAARLDDVNNRAMEDLNRRMSIEVKGKADSIIASRQKNAIQVSNNATPDTAQ